MKYKNYLGCLVLTIIGTANAAMALDCTQRPTCEELGYTSTPDECVGGKMAKCPWDYNAVFCVNASTGNGCEVGSVLYSDLNCYNTAPSGLTAVGIVFDTENRLAVALNEIALLFWGSNFGIGDSVLPWALSTNRCFAGCDSCNWLGTDGKFNTKLIVTAYGEGDYYAAGYCNAKTDGLPAGSWFLPSASEFVKLTKMSQNMMTAAGGKKLASRAYYWTSSQQDCFDSNKAIRYQINYVSGDTVEANISYYWIDESASNIITRCITSY